MATLSQLRNRIARKIKDPSFTGLSATAVDEEINRAVRYYQNFRFWFNEDEATITLTAGTQDVPSVPADLVNELQVNGLLLIDDQVKIDLGKLPADKFFESDDDQKGRPEYYLYKDGSFLLLPTPDKAYTLKLRYVKSYEDLTADGDSNDFTTYAEDLIMVRALKNIYAEDKDDAQYALVYSELERVELRAMRERSGNLLGTGYLQTQPIL